MPLPAHTRRRPTTRDIESHRQCHPRARAHYRGIESVPSARAPTPLYYLPPSGSYDVMPPPELTRAPPTELEKIVAKLEEDAHTLRASLASLSEKEETESFTSPSPIFEHPSVGQPRSSSLGASFHSEVGPIDRHQEVLARTQDALASLASIIEEFNIWRCIPIPFVLRATLEKFESTVVYFLDLDSSSIPLGRYSTLSMKLIRESTRLESEFRGMVDRFVSFNEKGLTPVYDGTQPLDTSEEIDELIVEELPPCDDVDLHSTIGTLKSSSACPKDLYPLPRIDQLVDPTAGCELLSLMDASQGYHQIPLAKEDWKRVSFITSKGTYCYVVMPFGLKNAGATYQRLVDQIFKDQLGRNMKVYVDDMLVKSKIEVDHVGDLRETFQTLRRFSMKLIPAKCSFAVKAGKFLGYMVTKRGIEVNPEKVRVVIEMKPPANVKEVQILTGRIAWLSRFIFKVAEKSSPLFKTLKKSSKFQWTEEAQKAFEELRETLANLPLLAKPIHGEELVLYISVGESA
ncbi:Unknown protein, partial [Striga hermonthica]